MYTIADFMNIMDPDRYSAEVGNIADSGSEAATVARNLALAASL